MTSKKGKNKPDDVVLEDNPSITLDLLSLVISEDIKLEEVTAWTPEMRKQAEVWAAQQHAMAADNRIPKKEQVSEPEFLKEVRARSFKRGYEDI